MVNFIKLCRKYIDIVFVVALAWDKNTETVKKPVISVQPWAQQTTIESPILYQQNSAPPGGYLNQQYQPQMQVNPF